MNHKLKMLSFAVVAALALSAVGASGASANNNRHFVSDSGTHTILDAEKVETQVFETTGGALGIECSKVSVSSTVNAATVTEITAVPHYTECVQKATPPRVVHVTMTSCAYTFTATRTTPNGGPEDPDSQVHIECSVPGDHIHIKVTTILGQLNCMTVPPQTPTGGGVTYETGTKNGVHDITINPTVSGISYTEQGACGSTTGNDGTYTGKVTVSGTDTVGNPVGITWT